MMNKEEQKNENKTYHKIEFSSPVCFNLNGVYLKIGVCFQFNDLEMSNNLVGNRSVFANGEFIVLSLSPEPFCKKEKTNLNHSNVGRFIDLD